MKKSGIMGIILILLICLSLGYILSEICKYLKIPRVIGEISAGIILSLPLVYELFNIGSAKDIINSLANIGIILLFFFIGININIAEFKKNFSKSALISLLNTLIPLSLGIIITKSLGYDFTTALIVGISLSVSSQMISADILEEFHLLKSKIGSLIIETGVIEDISQLILISIILTLIHSSLEQSGVIKIILSISIFIICIVIARYWLIPFILKRFEEGKSITTLFTGALIITMMLAALSEYLGLSSLLGAIISGIIVRQILLNGKNRKPWEEHELARTIHTISFGFLIPIFFIWIGLNTNITSIIYNYKFSLILIAIATFGTLIGSVIGIKIYKGTFKQGLITGFGLNSRGDVELVIASLALQSNLITQDIFSAIIFMTIIVTLISSIMFRKLICSDRKCY